MSNQRITTWVDLIRHGEPEGGPMFRGSKDDPLSESGWQQMHAAIGEQEAWDAVVSSSLQRCRYFAQALAQNRALPLYEDSRLREISFGEWEGMTAEAIMANDSQSLSRFWENPEHNTPPGGELLADFHLRVTEAWQHWQRQLAGKRILMVVHGGVIRMILAEVMGIPLARSFSALSVPYACRSRIRIDHSEYGVLSCLESHGIAPG